MYGDTEVMRSRAGQLREQGQAVRALADRLVAQAESVPWRGRAADTMRERIRERATRLREAAERHDVAASTMDAHVTVVDEAKDEIAQVERRARRLLDGQAPHPGALAGFEPPRPGHQDWLVVSLPDAIDADPDAPGTPDTPGTAADAAAAAAGQG